MTIEALSRVRELVVAGKYDLDMDTAQAVIARVDEFLAALDAVDTAMNQMPAPAISDAAAKLALVRYLSGRAWRRYVSDNPSVAAADEAVQGALGPAVAEFVAPLGQALSALPRGSVRRTGGGFALPCSVCDADAVTLTLSRAGPAAREQLVVSSLSPVTVFRSLAGPRMADLLALLEAGDVAAVVQHLNATQPGGCDAYCPECQRVYCKTHYSIEAQWTGSWHEATFATCALGHEHMVD